MIKDIWKFYVTELLKLEIKDESLILVDNLDCHVSRDSINLLADIGSIMCPLPPNTTSYCQPLDVGIMGPIKAKIRFIWLNEPAVDVHESASVLREKVIKRAVIAYEELTTQCVLRSWENRCFMHLRTWRRIK